VRPDPSIPPNIVIQPFIWQQINQWKQCSVNISRNYTWFAKLRPDNHFIGTKSLLLKNLDIRSGIYLPICHRGNVYGCVDDKSLIIPWRNVYSLLHYSDTFLADNWKPHLCKFSNSTILDMTLDTFFLYFDCYMMLHIRDIRQIMTCANPNKLSYAPFAYFDIPQATLRARGNDVCFEADISSECGYYLEYDNNNRTSPQPCY
jgi:hypothetical protein